MHSARCIDTCALPALILPAAPTHASPSTRTRTAVWRLIRTGLDADLRAAPVYSSITRRHSWGEERHLFYRLAKESGLLWSCLCFLTQVGIAALTVPLSVLLESPDEVSEEARSSLDSSFSLPPNLLSTYIQDVVGRAAEMPPRAPG